MLFGEEMTDEEFKRRQAEEMEQFNETDGDDRMFAAKNVLYLVHTYERMLEAGEVVTPKMILDDVKTAILTS